MKIFGSFLLSTYCQIEQSLNNITHTNKFLQMPSTSTRQKSLVLARVLAPYSIGYQIRLLSQLMSHQEFQGGSLEPFGLTPFHGLCCAA